MEITVARVAILLVLLSVSCTLSAKTVVTTYVTEVQEERRSTRWTLTEWLRIKERMRMMDLWLALFSNPKKDCFSPELALGLGARRGKRIKGDTVTGISSREARAQLWLTNLISGTTGIRTVNIDLGVEGMINQASTSGFDPAASSANGLFQAKTDEGAEQSDYGTANLRLFGKHVQDSSLVLKYGRYHSTDPDADTTHTEQRTIGGIIAGGDLTVYLTHWLGMEGRYLHYGDEAGISGQGRGHQVNYTAFIEVSLLRLGVGQYEHIWNGTTQAADEARSEKGYAYSVVLQF